MPVVQEDLRRRSSPRSPVPTFRGANRQKDESSSSAGLEYSESSTVKQSRARDRELFSSAHRPYCKTSVTDSRKVSPRSTASPRPADQVLRTRDPVFQTSNNSEPCKNFNLMLYDGSPTSAPVGGGTIVDSACLTTSGYQMTDFVERVDRLTVSSLQPVHNLVITNGTTGNPRYRMTGPPMPANSTRRMVDCKLQDVEAVDAKPESSVDAPLLAIEGPRDVLVRDFTRSHQEPYVGLYNHGNTCYMSVIFQCLRFTPSFFDTCRLAQTDRMNPPKKLLRCIGLLLDGMAQKASNKDLYSSVETIRAELGHVAPHFKGPDQQDALEFLLSVLDSLHSELKQSSTSTSPESSRTQTPDTTLIDNNSMPPLEHALRNNTSDSLLPSRPRLHNGGNTVPGNITTTVPPTCQPPVSTKKTGRSLSGLFRVHKKQGAKKLSRVILTTNCCPPVCHAELPVPPVTEGVHPKNLAWDQENMRESSPIKDIFMGQLQTYRECQVCGCEAVSYEVVWNLSVPIPTDTLVNGTSSSPMLDGDTGRRYGGSLHNTVNTKYHTNSSPGVPKRFPPRSTPEINNPLFDGSSRQGGNTWPSRNSNTNLLGDPRIPSVLGYRSPVGDGKARYQSNFYTPLVPCVPASVTEAVPPRQVSLSQCLKAHTLTETLDGSDRPWCEKCQEKAPCLIQSSLSRLPDVLVIHLLRFHCDGRNSKNTVNVNFDMKLDMSEYMTSEYDRRHRFSADHRDKDDRIFWLYAVVYHDGMMNYGHYTAACLTATAGDDQSVEGRWYLFDDEIVKEIKPELVNRASAYLLFYERDSLHKQRLTAATREKCDTSSHSQNVTLSTRL